MVKDHKAKDKGIPLPLQLGLHFLISSKKYYIHHPPNIYNYLSHISCGAVAVRRNSSMSPSGGTDPLQSDAPPLSYIPLSLSPAFYRHSLDNFLYILTLSSLYATTASHRKLVIYYSRLTASLNSMLLTSTKSCFPANTQRIVSTFLRVIGETKS